MPWPYTLYGSLRSPVESFISIRSHHLQQTTQASRKVSRYDLFAAPCFASLRFKRVWEVQLGWSSSSQRLAPKQKERVYQKNQPKVLSHFSPIPYPRLQIGAFHILDFTKLQMILNSSGPFTGYRGVRLSHMEAEDAQKESATEAERNGHDRLKVWCDLNNKRANKRGA